MLIQSSLIPSPNISMEGFTGFGRATNTSSVAANISTAMFGGLRLAQFPMAAISTTAIQTGPTTDWKTWSAFRRKSTSAKRWQPSQSALSTKRRVQQPLNGTVRKLDAFGTGDTPHGKRIGQNGSVSPRIALSAILNLWRSFGNRAMSRFIAHLPARLRPTESAALIQPPRLVIESVKRLNETADVWCMSVPSVEEFSLANGALVHNCSHPADAMRMLAISWNKHQFSEKKTHNPHTLLVGEENSATLNDMWASRPRQRRQRI
jgi:hypothetical protein